jgi:hypothetical protein
MGYFAGKVVCKEGAKEHEVRLRVTSRSESDLEVENSEGFVRGVRYKHWRLKGRIATCDGDRSVAGDTSGWRFLAVTFCGSDVEFTA